MADEAERLRASGLPALLVEHLLACLGAGLSGRALSALQAHPDDTVIRVKALLAGAASVTGLSPDELLRRTDLGADDLRGHRVDSALAELRAVCFLSALGFTKVAPLESDPARRRADLAAELDGERWAVDARCASRTLLPEGSFRRGEDGAPLPYPTLHDYLVHCRSEKDGQLRRTMADEGCARAAVVVALDGTMPGPAMRGEAFRAWLASGGGTDFRFGLMPGLFGPTSPDDALVPAP